MKKNVDFVLQSNASDSFRCIKAANSVDINVEKKLTHRFNVNIDLQPDYKVGLIVGASGSGKTTLAKHLWGDSCFDTVIDNERPIIDQFDPAMSYDDCVDQLTSIGLSQVPCWIRPVKTLSNGQRFRAEIALQLSMKNKPFTIIDEWTSVVDRTVAKVMSHAVQKHARRNNKQIVLCSCHYDVIE